MKWYYKVMGGHTHVRVFMNSAKCGDLCFRNEEFEAIRRSVGSEHRCAPLDPFITFIEEK